MRRLLLASLLWMGPLAAVAAEPGAPEAAPPETAATPDAGATDEAAAAGEKLDQIDQILQGEEDVFLDTGYTYDPGDRRDPFKSLLAQQEMLGPKGVRPEGVPGLLIDEVTLTGIFHTGQGFIAQVQAADKDKSFLLKIGDQLYDGDVVSITGSEVVFKKIVNDPTRLKPFVEVVKKLSP